MKVNTVTGEIAPEALGKTLIHEHVICSSAEMMGSFHPAWNPPERVVPRVTAILKTIREEYGITTIVDGTPLSLGRDLDLLKEVSEKAEVNIIASTGFYLYDCFTAKRVAPSLLARFLIEEIQKGRIRPGFLKCAVEDVLTPCQKSYITAIAHVHLATGLPIFAHSHARSKSGLAILDLLEENKVPLQKVIIGHTGDAADLSCPLAMLERGANISIDRIAGEGISKGDLAGELIKMGYADRLFLSHDAICFDDKCNFPEYEEYEASGMEKLSSLPKYVVPRLIRAGIPEEAFQKIFIENVKRLFL